MSAEILEGHVEQCPACAEWREMAHSLARRMRLRVARSAHQPPPELIEAVLGTGVPLGCGCGCATCVCGPYGYGCSRCACGCDMCSSQAS